MTPFLVSQCEIYKHYTLWLNLFVTQSYVWCICGQNKPLLRSLSYQFWSSVTVWHTWKFKRALLVHKRSGRWPNIFFVILWICTKVGKIVFSPISKHLRLDFSMSHSNEWSRSEQISPRTERQKDRKVERLEVEKMMNRTQKTFTRSPMNS